MAAYASTVTARMRKAIKLGDGLVGYSGQVDVTNYNSTLAEITAITGKFRDGDPEVMLGGISDNGYLVAWDQTSKSIKAWYPVTAHTHVIPVTAGTAGDAVTNNAGVLESTGGQDLAASAATAGPGTEVANDVDIGAVDFFAVGLG